MNCKKCGNVLNPTDVLCPSCGEPVNPPAPMTSSVQEVVTDASVATPMATTDVAVNPNVMVQQTAPQQAPATVSPVQEVANNGPVATTMASTDVAVNPNVIMQPNDGAEAVAASPAAVTEPVANQAPVQNAQPIAQMAAPVEAVPTATPAVEAVPSATTQPVVDVNATPDAATSAVPVADPNAQAGMTAPNAVEQVPPVVNGVSQAAPAPAADGKKKLDIKFIVIVSVLVILIISLGVFVGTKLFGSDNNGGANTNNTASDNNKDDNNKEENGNTTTPVAKADEYISNGYIFTIPSELKYTQEDEWLMFSDKDNFLVNLIVLPASYDALKSDKSIKDLVKELDVKEIAHTETRLNGVKYTLISYEVDNSYGLIYYSGLDDYHMSFGLVFGKESSSYDTAFEYISKIIKNAKTVSNFAPEEDKHKDYTIDKGMLDSGNVEGIEYKL